MDTAPIPLPQQDSETGKCAIMKDETLPNAPRLQQDFSGAKCGLHQDSTTAMDTAPIPLPQQDSETGKCAIMKDETLPNAPRLQQDFSGAKCGLHQDSITAMDTTPVPLLQQGLTTTKFEIINDATLSTPHLQQDFSEATCGLHQDSITAMDTILVPLPQQDSAATNIGEPTTNKANPTPTPIVPLVNQDSPAGTTNIKIEMEATPNPSLQLDSKPADIVLNAPPISIKWPGQDEIITLNKGKRGRKGRREMVLAQELIKNSIAGPNDGNADGADEPWWTKNWVRDTRPRASSKVTDAYYYHKTIDVTCRSLVEAERFEFDGISPYVARKQRKLEAEAEAANSTLLPTNQNEKEACSKNEKTAKKGQAAEGSLKVEGDMKRKRKEVEGSPEEGGKIASQTPISESVKLDGSGLADVPFFHCVSGSTNQGSSTFVAGQLTQSKEVEGNPEEGGKTASLAAISETVKLDVPVFHCTSSGSTNQGSTTSVADQLTESQGAEGSLKEVGDVQKKRKKVERSPGKGGKTASQAPISETVKLDVPVLHCTRGKQGSSTSVTGQRKKGRKMKKQNDGSRATKTAFANEEARFNAAMSALARMEAKFEEMIELQIENRKLLQASMAFKGNYRSKKK
ncbi:hypothetical protein SLEP1_g7685 [Rubroshorea leprosula]|uniref:Uncharacterized protein n=1 Tax=Rubroshorea leprosula TaxID=152421 RepID=A0AAV5I7L1_9ROSI|nr:hypothetical protein SLEP1_g7685 [Rubroshorea leprosula]